MRRGSTENLYFPEVLIQKNFRKERPQVFFSSKIVETLQSCPTLLIAVAAKDPKA